MRLATRTLHVARQHPWTAALLLALAISLAFQGSRALWEPDEGRYVNGSLSMLDSGEWLVPRVLGHTYLDKPPLIFWSVALGVEIFGADEWGPRLVHTLWLVLTALFVGVLARKLWGEGVGPLALVAYSVTLAPAAAANILTPDTILTCFVVLGFLGYLSWLESEREAARWLWAAVFGMAFGLGMLAKGTAMLIFAAPIAAHLVLRGQSLRALRSIELWMAVVLAVSIGGSWYLAVSAQIPEAASYFFDNQVSGRLWENHYQRNSEWWAPFRIFLPVLTLGAFPIFLFWPRWILRRWRTRRDSSFRALLEDPGLLLFLWVALPLLIFSLASSRLELYMLPLLAPLVIATVGQVRGPTSPPRAWWLAIASAALVLVALKATSSLVTPFSDSRALAAAMRAHGIPEGTLVVGVHDKRGALPIYGYPNVRWTEFELDQPYFSPPKLFDETVRDLIPRCHHGELGETVVFTGRQGRDVLLDQLLDRGLDCDRLKSHAEPRVHLVRCRCGPR